jgi:hypothetical protein
VLLMAAACGASGSAEAERPAMSLTVVASSFQNPRILLDKSLPPGFQILFDREMPTPGWRFTVDSVHVDTEIRRIVARLSEIPPSGVTAPGITQTPCRVPLGRLQTGRYILELWSRRGEEGPHGLEQVLVLAAGGD